jgi:hypothetical protein
MRLIRCYEVIRNIPFLRELRYPCMACVLQFIPHSAIVHSILHYLAMLVPTGVLIAC